MKRSWVFILAVILSAGLAAGCSAKHAVQNARTSFEKAKAAGAETKAPYEYYAAEAYLGLAEHEMDERDKDGIRLFSEKSEQMSAEALNKAGGGAK
jgi:hypothetical protein